MLVDRHGKVAAATAGGAKEIAALVERTVLGASGPTPIRPHLIAAHPS